MPFLFNPLTGNLDLVNPSVVPGGGIINLNGLIAGAQTFATGSSGTNFNISSSGSAHTFNIPDASATNRGAVTTGSQTIAGSKTFTSPIIAPDGTLGAPGIRFTTDNDSGFYQTGDGNVSLAANGFLRFQVDQNETTVTGPLIVTGNISANNYPPTGTSNFIAQFNGLGDLAATSSYQINADGGMDSSTSIDLNNQSGGQSFQGQNLSFGSLQNSPNEQWNLNNYNIQIDPDSDGFNMGTAGQLFNMFNLGYSHQGTSDIGSINYFTMNNDIGNGTDPISVNGLGYFTAFGNIDNNVTFSGAIQPFVTGINIASGATMNNGVTVFSDQNNIDTAVPQYTVINAGPNVSEIKNNTNFTGINLNPTIDTFTGNAAFNGIAISGNFGTFDTGAWQGILMNPTVDDVGNATGIFVDMANVTASGTKTAAYFGGDVQITGSLTFGGALSIGQLSAFYGTNPVDGGGTPTTLHSLVSSMTALDGVTTANVDSIGVNTAMLITLEDNSVSTSGPFGLGFTALALPCVVETHTGSSLDFMSGTTSAINLAGTSTGGTIDTVKVSRSVAVPNGITTINNLRGFEFDTPFGDVGTVMHAFYTDVANAQNYMHRGLVVGELTEVLTNASVGLEISSSTKVFLNARMTTTERNALTPVNGMQVYNSTTDKLQVYAAGSWVDLH